MGKSPLVEVLGSFASNVVTRKMHEKYQVVGYGNGMHVDMGMRFSVNFGHKKFTRKISCNFCWYWYWDAHVLRK